MADDKIQGGMLCIFFTVQKGCESMALDARLQAVAAFVPSGSRAVDIGTDHAYLALSLQQERGAASVIAADKNAGPCEAARHTLREAGLEDVIPVRQGDGLAVLKPGEVDTICIAGMGGQLIKEILAAEPAVLAGTQRLVLQPMNAAENLRRWLYTAGWHIADEALAADDGRLYEIIVPVPGRVAMPEEVLLSIGPVLWEKKPPLLREHIEALLGREKRVADGMGKSERARQSEAYQAARQRVQRLEEKCEW